jgi:hypothetical protein
MDKLEKYMQIHRSEFDSDEPSNGHFERFNDRLKPQKPIEKFNLYLVACAAAVAGFILTASVSLLLNYGGLTPLAEKDLALGLPPEVAQIDEYYRYKVTQKQELITKMMVGDLSPMEKEIANTLAEMDRSYLSLKQDIYESPRPDRAAYVLTLYYQVQIEVLEQIIVRLQDVTLIN